MFATSVFRSADFITAVAWNAATPSTNSNVVALAGAESFFTPEAGSVLVEAVSRCRDVGSNFTDTVSGSDFTLLTFSAVSPALGKSGQNEHRTPV